MKLFNLFNTLRSRIVLGVSLVVLLVAIAITLFVHQSLTGFFKNSQRESARNILDSVYNLVDTQYKSIAFHKKAALESKKRELQDITKVVFSYINHYYHQASIGKITQKKAKREVLKLIKNIRYDNGVGYIWINNTERPYPKMVMHPTIPSLEGIVLKDTKYNNALGSDKNLFQAFVDVALWQGYGFVNYMWPKPVQGGLTEQRPKISFVQLFRPWGWVVGTGLYYDEVEEEEQRRYEKVLEELRSVFAKTQVGNSGYLYLFDSDYKILIHPSLVGKDMTKVENPATGNILFDEVIEASKNPKIPFRYLWNKPPKDHDNFHYWKQAYVRKFKPLGWYLVSTYYEDEINSVTENIINQIAIAVGIILFIALIGTYFFAATLLRPIKEFSTQIKNIHVDDIDSVHIPTEWIEEVKELAESFNGLAIKLADSRNAQNERESILSAIYNSSFQLMGLLDRNGTLLSVNKTALNLIEAKAEDVCGKPFWDTPWWNHSLDVYNHIKKDIEQAQKGELVHSSTIHKRPDGGAAYVEFTLTPVLDSNNELLYIIAEGRDVTENKLAEINQNKNIKFLSGLERVNHILSAPEPSKEVLERLVQSLLDMFEADRVLIIDFKTKTISQVVHSPQYDLSVEYRSSLQDNLFLQRIYGQCVQSKDVVSYYYDGSVDQWREQSEIPYLSGMSHYFSLDDGSEYILEIHQCSSSREWEQFEIRLIKEIVSRLCTVLDAISFQQSLIERERLIKDIIDNSSAVIALRDTDGHFITVNKEFESQFNVKEEDLIGSKDDIIFSPDRVAKYREGDQFVIESKKAVQVEENLYTKDGELYYITTRFPLFDVTGAVYAVCSISTDITDRKKVEKTLEKMVDERTKQIELQKKDLEANLSELKRVQRRLVAQEKLASLGTLASGIAHEIKNPLNFIINSGKIISTLLTKLNSTLEKGRDEVDTPVYESISSISKQLHDISALITKHGARSDEIVRSMIDFTSNNESELGEVDLNELLRDSIQIGYSAAKQRLERVVLPSLYIESERKICLYPSEFQRAILHILDNSFYAVNEKANNSSDEYIPKIEINVRFNKTEMEIVMIDNGIGIPREIDGKIFDPFVSNKPAGEGAGLGLTMAFDIIAKHKGDITYSKEGDYTVFVITIPTNLNE